MRTSLTCNRVINDSLSKIASPPVLLLHMLNYGLYLALSSMLKRPARSWCTSDALKSRQPSASCMRPPCLSFHQSCLSPHFELMLSSSMPSDWSQACCKHAKREACCDEPQSSVTHLFPRSVLGAEAVAH